MRMIMLLIIGITLFQLADPPRVVMRGEDVVPLISALPRSTSLPPPSACVATMTTPVYVPCTVSTGTITYGGPIVGSAPVSR